MRSFTLAARLGFWLVLAAITVLSLLPLQFAVQSGVSDKIEHFVAYAALTAAGRIGHRDKPAPWILALAIVFYGIAIEIGQSFIPGRVMSGWDVFANTTGVMIGLGLSRLVLSRLPSHPS
jgi:VanZ family protein